MTEFLTSAQMRAIERAAIDSGQVSGLELMERAGAGVVAAILAQWPDLAQGRYHRAVVLCGPGNNGGDGFIIARLLLEHGWLVDVFLYGDPETLPPDARQAHARWQARPRRGKLHRLSVPAPALAEIEALDQATQTTIGAAGPDLIIDALFGTGLTRPITALQPMLETLQIDCPVSDRTDGPPYVVAVDMPSGVCADSGRVLGDARARAVGADLTVAFHARKPGHVLGEGAAMCGKVVVASIGLEHDGSRNRRALAELHGLTDERSYRGVGCKIAGSLDVTTLHPDLSKSAGHKYAHGHALILSGGPGRGGAARLAARGALRIGAGLVSVGCPPEALVENAARLDAVMLRVVSDGAELTQMLTDTRINALCLGPGLGLGAREAGLVAAALATGRATVLDADALTLIAQDRALFASLHETCVLTPHAGEFARLFPDLAQRLDAPATSGPACSKLDATRDAAARTGCIVLFKGPDTVIAAPDGRASISAAFGDRAAPWLATAGSGDVLAGFIAGLLARGFGPMAAAETAACLHLEAALDFGPGLIAEDLPECLPQVFRRLGV
ncbi:MAG: NAD(P)H-hydrate dehydratase [Natronohydrobacter sp.]|nr:NAD(P)H-hydrate dehydratase [Natronohydrobacter sp.]